MKTNYTDTQLQAAIDGACNEVAQSAIGFLNTLDLDPQSEVWAEETPARLQLIKSALDALPEPEPPSVDWKAKAERVEHERNGWSQMHGDMKVRAEKAEAELARVREACDRMSKQEVLSRSQLRPLAEAGEVPEGAVRVYGIYSKHYKQWLTASFSSDQDTHCADIRVPQEAVGINGLTASEEAQTASVAGLSKGIKPQPETFKAHGKTWIKHNGGDPMPCDKDARIHFITNRNIALTKAVFADDCCWDALSTIIGWRYTDEPEPTKLILPPWPPVSGDVVTLRSGGPKMTVIMLKDAECRAIWFHDGVPRECDFLAATLTPA